ncbi:P2Y purinoceptor 14 [Danio rerio]|uniref:Probable G-protein coupled receptor 34 n=1 Tax=Danio rerio TaxID=7955 RepID=A0A8M3B0N9_DANRE|nr:P2Y purinoceptor 14-like [Danio rerio]|eukprot:XP_009289705.1 P2Y purinoceptor 14-like [Danio rerio]
MTNTTEALCEVPANEVFIFAYSLVFLVSLVLNCFPLAVHFCSDQRVQSSITVYMNNLIAADFFLCLSLLLRIASYADSTIMMFNIYCSFGATAFYINMYASILFMEFIAINRYLKIVRPLETHTLQTVRTARYISGAIWFVLLAISSIYVILYLSTSWSKTKPEVFICDFQDSSQISAAYTSVHSASFVIFIFILVSLIFLYWKTLQKLREVQLSTQAEFNRQKFRKSKQNMLVLVVIFCVCFVPYHLVRLPYIFIRHLLNDCTSIQALHILKEVTALLAALNVSLDPLIYFFFCKAFRDKVNLISCQNCP